MGGAQPLAAVMAGAHCIAIEVQESRIEKRLETRYLDRRATSIDEALEIIQTANKPTSVGLLGNAAEIVPEMLAAEFGPTHSPTNQRSRPGQRLLPGRLDRRQMAGHARARSGRGCRCRAIQSRATSRRCSPFKEMGIPTFDYGNNIRQEA